MAVKEFARFSTSVEVYNMALYTCVLNCLCAVHPVATDVTRNVVCLSVCLSVCVVCCEPIETLFVGLTLLGPRNVVLDGVKFG